MLPDDWKIAQISPIFKKGHRYKPGNYRPVSLTSGICKILEKLVRRNIIDHLEQNELIDPAQHGFVKGRSCVTNLLETFEQWTQILDDGGSIDVIYMDFMKAFDKVPHLRLLIKLQSYGICNKTLAWIKAFLAGRHQRVVVNAWTQVGVERSDQWHSSGKCSWTALVRDVYKRLTENCSVWRQTVRG